MRRTLLLASALFAAWSVIPVAQALAQQGGGGDDEQQAQKKKKRDDEWELRQAPLPGKHNAGPCPFVKVLYDAARYEEFKDNQEASSSVAYTGEIEGIRSDCEYKDLEPIKVRMQVLFSLGKGPQAPSSKKTYRYWVAVTHRNHEVLAKQYFDLPVSFSTDRARMADNVNGIVIPRASQTVAGDNFEVLVGFDVTPEMAAFNRDGKRFRLNAGAPAAEAQAGGR
jgi:hypothetical protein